MGDFYDRIFLRIDRADESENDDTAFLTISTRDTQEGTR
jgi:hypothetical protein